MQRKVKFRFLSKYKRNNPKVKVYYICLNDKRKVHVDYLHHFGFQIITGMKAWEFFCERADIDIIDLINYLKALVHSWQAVSTGVECQQEPTLSGDYSVMRPAAKAN